MRLPLSASRSKTLRSPSSRLQCRGLGGELRRLREEKSDDGLCRSLSTIAGASAAILGRGGRGDRLGQALGPGARRQPPAVLPLVHGGAAEYLLECARPA